MKTFFECYELAEMIAKIIDVKLEMHDDYKIADYRTYRERKKNELDPLITDLARLIYKI